MHGFAPRHALCGQPFDFAADGPLFADPQVDQSQFEQPFDGPFALQPADFPQQDRGQPFFVAVRHASESWVKVQRTEAACGS